MPVVYTALGACLVITGLAVAYAVYLRRKMADLIGADARATVLDAELLTARDQRDTAVRESEQRYANAFQWWQYAEALEARLGETRVPRAPAPASDPIPVSPAANVYAIPVSGTPVRTAGVTPGLSARTGRHSVSALGERTTSTPVITTTTVDTRSEATA